MNPTAAENLHNAWSLVRRLHRELAVVLTELEAARPATWEAMPDRVSSLSAALATPDEWMPATVARTWRVTERPACVEGWVTRIGVLIDLARAGGPLWIEARIDGPASAKDPTDLLDAYAEATDPKPGQTQIVWRANNHRAVVGARPLVDILDAAAVAAARDRLCALLEVDLVDGLAGVDPVHAMLDQAAHAYAKPDALRAGITDEQWKRFAARPDLDAFAVVFGKGASRRFITARGAARAIRAAATDPAGVTRAVAAAHLKLAKDGAEPPSIDDAAWSRIERHLGPAGLERHDGPEPRYVISRASAT